MDLKYYKNLDGVRAIAALMVMFFHFSRKISPDTRFLQFLTKISIFGQTGVTLFFVLSGFLITRILLYNKGYGNYFKNFFVRRSLRIFPLYYLFLLISFFILPYLFNIQKTSINQQLYYYFYLQNFARTFSWSGWITANGPGHFWSLAVEEHFYMVWPFIIYFLSTRNIKKAVFVIILLALFLRIIMLSKGLDVFYFTFTRFDSLAIGGLLALIENKGGIKSVNSKKFLILAGIVFIPTIYIWTNFTGAGNHMLQIFKYLLLSLTYFSFIGFLLTLKSNNFLNKILECSFLSYTGRISYGLYVYHPIAYLIAGVYLNTNYLVINIIIHFGLAYFISAVSYYFFENYFIGLKKYFDHDKQIKATKLVN